MIEHVDFRLYLATDPALTGTRDLGDIVRIAVENGVSLVQLREKHVSARSFFETARALHAVTAKAGVPLIINDRVDIMLAVGAEGVHVGRGDLPVAAARKLAGNQHLLGYSVNTAEHLETAEAAGADYVGVGPVFATSTKDNTPPPLGIDGLRAIVRRASIPCVAIGGINAENAADVVAAGADGCCVISAILGQQDIAAATRDINAAIRSGFRARS